MDETIDMLEVCDRHTVANLVTSELNLKGKDASAIHAHPNDNCTAIRLHEDTTVKDVKDAGKTSVEKLDEMLSVLSKKA